MQNCLILGAGVSGIQVTKFLLARQFNVYIHDKDKTKLRELFDAKIIDNRANPLEKINRKTLQFFDTVVVSPGVSLSKKFLRECQMLKINVLSEVDLASMFCSAPIFAVTGTNGKTTTVNFLHQIFCFVRKDSHLVGNVGTPFCSEIDKISQKSKVVLEISSFQLEHCEHLRCNACAILNFAPDHLDRYKNLDEYENTKAHLIDCVDSGGVAVLNYDDERVRARGVGLKNILYFSTSELPKGVKGYFLRDGKVMLNLQNKTKEILTLPEIKIRGQHNLSNLLCAIALAHIGKIAPNKIESALTKITLPRHRIEFAGEKGGVKFFNDSKATNIHSTRSALATFDEPIHLLLGGSDKGEKFGEFLARLPQNVVTLTAFGKMGRIIYRKAKSNGVSCKYFPRLSFAFDYVKKIAKSGDVVLLSPACASFDEFSNYEERGDCFCNLVAEWLSEK